MIINRLLFLISIFSMTLCTLSQCSFNSFDFIDRSGLTSPYLQIPVYERAQEVVNNDGICEEEIVDGCCEAEEE